MPAKREGRYIGEPDVITKTRIEQANQKIKAGSSSLNVQIEPNLFLRRDPKSGVPYWIFRYKFAKQNQQNKSLGRYGTVTVAQALKAADRCRDWLKENKDPITEARKERERGIRETAGTLAHVIADWLKRNESHWAPRNYKRHVSVIRRCFPRLLARPIKDIEIADMRAALEQAQEKRGVITAYQARTTAVMIWKYAIAAGLCDKNPARDLDEVLKKRPAAKHHPALPREQIGPFLRTLSKSGCAPVTQNALRMLMLTGVRVNSLRLARWDEFDIANARWVIPAHHMKGKLTHRQDFALPLSRQAIAILKDQRALLYEGPGALVFRGRGRGHHYGELAPATLTHSIRDLGFSPATCHGFRALLFSWALDEGYPRDAADVQLAHVIGNQTTRAYMRADFWEQRMRMVQHWADFVEAEEKGTTARRASNVRKLRARVA